MKKMRENAVKPRKKKMHPITVLFILAYTVIPVVNWLIFYVYCNFSAFFMGFTDKDGLVSLANFVRFFEEFAKPTSEIRIALKNTLITFAVIFIFDELIVGFERVITLAKRNAIKDVKK